MNINTKSIYNENGSIFTVLLGGIAMVALISLAAYQLMSGPLASASRLTQNNMVNTQLPSIGHIAIMDAANIGDCDADGYTEARPWRAATGPVVPGNGGLIPLAMGAPTLDPWGTEYGYCTWDIGPTSADAGCGGGTGMLDGADDPTAGESQSAAALAVISAGPDRQFQTTCNNYTDGTTDVITTSGDDIIQRFTYAEAANKTSALWKLKTGDPTTAAIDKDLTIGSNISVDSSAGSIQAQSMNTTGKIIAGGGLELADQTAVLDGSCMLATAGTLRFNSVTDQAEICLDTGSWAVLSSGLSWPLLAPNGSDTAPSYAFSNFSGAGLYHNATKMEFVAAHPKTTLGAAAGTAFRVASKGGVQIGDTTVTCAGAAEGTLKFSVTDKELVFCDGTDWVPFYIPPTVWIAPSLISAGDDYSCGIKPDGTAWCWGDNYYSQLGDGTTNDNTSPVAVSGGYTWKAVTGGSRHSCGIQTDDTGWCWGYNTNGRLGDGTTTDRSTPVAVSGGDTWKAISTGGRQSCGLKTDNTAWCWGQGYKGGLGNGSTSDSYTPVAVSGGYTWKIISTGGAHSCGIQDDDTAWCWGNNFRGRLGDGTQTERSSPVAVSGGDTWKTIAAGSTYTCGVKTDGTAWCWGMNHKGQLGDGTTAERHLPTEVSGSSTWEEITASQDGYHSCGIKTDGTAWCWGYNLGGQLGDSTTTDRLTPVTVSGGATWKQITTGSGHSCGIKADDTPWCWGSNYPGQLGDSTQTSSPTPVAVSGW
jgi:alpha-tubulin suppressor-like RCC1 family protein